MIYSFLFKSHTVLKVRIGGGYENYNEYVARKYTNKGKDAKEIEELKKEKESTLSDHMHSIMVTPTEIPKGSSKSTKWKS